MSGRTAPGRSDGLRLGSCHCPVAWGTPRLHPPARGPRHLRGGGALGSKWAMRPETLCWAGLAGAVLSGNHGAARSGAEICLRETKRSSCDQRGNLPWCCGLRVPPTPTAKFLCEPKGGCWEVGGALEGRLGREGGAITDRTGCPCGRDPTELLPFRPWEDTTSLGPARGAARWTQAGILILDL